MLRLLKFFKLILLCKYCIWSYSILRKDHHTLFSRNQLLLYTSDDNISNYQVKIYICLKYETSKKRQFLNLTTVFNLQVKSCIITSLIEWSCTTVYDKYITVYSYIMTTGKWTTHLRCSFNWTESCLRVAVWVLGQATSARNTECGVLEFLLSELP